LKITQRILAFQVRGTVEKNFHDPKTRNFTN